MQDNLRAAFLQLSRDQGTALHLAYNGGDSTGHIAARLGVSETTAKSLLHDALHALRDAVPHGAAAPSTCAGPKQPEPT
ncbi:MAG: sigma factor-like helix-turn-helix DNA-binding protein [Mycobacterium sp.]